MARRSTRSSARIASRRTSSTPQRVSLPHDAPLRTPRTAPSKLVALQENDEMPGAFPQSSSPVEAETSMLEAKHTSRIPLKFDESTPKQNTPIKPAAEEMHPDKRQQSTAKPLEEARWLGFSSMAPHTEPPKQSSKIAVLQNTPTRAARVPVEAEAPKFQFTFRREQSLELSPEAKKLMDEKREEAAKIREMMISSGEASREIAGALGRRIATPRSAKGRFSDVHRQEFQKMDSIANHPSALRAAAVKAKPTEIAVQMQTTSQKVHQVFTSPTKSLKRSPSKPELDESHLPQQSSLSRTPSKVHIAHSSSLPRSTSTKNLHDTDEERSPAKRMKRSAGEDVSIARTSSSGRDKPLPATPAKKVQIVSPHVSTLASPTEAFLARISGTNASKLPGPALHRTPSKPTLVRPAQVTPDKPSTPLLARSPSKAALFVEQSTKKTSAEGTHTTSLLLARSPLKGSVMSTTTTAGEQGVKRVAETPLLSRSPLKASITAKSSDDRPSDVKQTSSTPLLARSPAKFTIQAETQDGQSTGIPSKSSGTNLLGRFNLLRASPMKSILRSPQRLFSDDPAKIAAGTHLATPPKFALHKSAGAKTAPVSKHVDFTSSTKDRYERAQSELSSTPSKARTPSSKTEAAVYPSLPSIDFNPAITPQSRRQTAAPGDFTFRNGEHGIIFGPSPNAPRSPASSSRASTIRHVSAEPQFPPASIFAPITTTKKRKFEFENHKAVDAEMAMDTSDKENTNAEEGEERPAKRMKQSAPTPSPVKPTAKPAATRRPTLGVKPKKSEVDAKAKKAATTISRARLNALAQPKKRT